MGSVFTCKLNPCCGDRLNCDPPRQYDSEPSEPTTSPAKGGAEAQKPDDREQLAEAFDYAASLAVPVYPSDNASILAGVERYRMQLVLMAAKVRTSAPVGQQAKEGE